VNGIERILSDLRSVRRNISRRELGGPPYYIVVRALDNCISTIELFAALVASTASRQVQP
jgi:hypothetical protein